MPTNKNPFWSCSTHTLMAQSHSQQVTIAINSEHHTNNNKRSFTSMAESSTNTNYGNSNTNDGSPIANLAQDHIFTILLRLPVDSILSFAMTCKRFRSLTSSDVFWESICRRDWGPKQVDAFKSSNEYQMLPWMWLYKQVSQLESVSCYKLSDPEGDLVLPNPRASHSLNFVSNCLILFGGGCEGGRYSFSSLIHI